MITVAIRRKNLRIARDVLKLKRRDQHRLAHEELVICLAEAVWSSKVKIKLVARVSHPGGIERKVTKTAAG